MNVTMRHSSVTFFISKAISVFSCSELGFLPALLVAGVVPEPVVIDDDPTPVTVVVQALDPGTILMLAPASRVGAFQREDSCLDLFQGDVGLASNRFVGHVHDPIRVSQDYQIHEDVAEFIVLGNGTTENLLEDFRIHIKYSSPHWQSNREEVLLWKRTRTHCQCGIENSIAYSCSLRVQIKKKLQMRQ